MVISNLGSIVLSLPSAGSSATANAAQQVRLLSFFNTISRLLVGPLADVIAPVASRLESGVWGFAGKRHTSRVAFMLGICALLSVTFLAAHIVGAVVEDYVDIGWLSAVVPFTAGWKPLGVGLGTIAVDLLAAVALTSALRHRMPPGVWRGVHLSAYALWPVALVHAVVTSSVDVALAWVVSLSCLAAGVSAVLWRLRRTDPDAAARRLTPSESWR